MTIAIKESLFDRVWECLCVKPVDAKLEAVQRLAQDWYTNKLSLTSSQPVQTLTQPGMPDQLVLVHPAKVERRRLGSMQGRIALHHAIAHIEFSAINLALDAIYRFRDMPQAYYVDWLNVACEECYHFRLIRHQLNDMDTDYGDLPAHEGLWDVAQYSRDDVLHRMALVPRVLEARGLDVTPAMIERVLKIGDTDFADVLKIIFRDEVGHVAIGSHWFRVTCQKRGMDPEATFSDMIRRYQTDMNAQIKGPFQEQARLSAGFSRVEIEHLTNLNMNINTNMEAR